MRSALGKRIIFKILLCLMPAMLWKSSVVAESAQMLLGTIEEEEKILYAQQKAHDLINNHVDPEYHLTDLNYGMSERQRAELEQLANDLISGCTNDYEKIKTITIYVADSIYYDWDYDNGKGNDLATKPYDVYTQKRAVCSGYANLVKALCNLVDIPCMNIHAFDHAYNAAYDSQEKRWIFLDATWLSGNSYEDGQWIYNGASLALTLFDMDPELMASMSNHEIYYVDGVLDSDSSGIYYRFCTDWDDWSNTEKWYLEIRERREGDDIKAIGSIDGVNVTQMRNGVFINSSLESIDLSQTQMTEIGAGAFSGCNNLIAVKLPSTLMTIGYGAFEKCTLLEAIDLSQTQVTEIEGYVFAGCTNLSMVKLPLKCIRVKDGVFENCTSLETIDMSQTQITDMGKEIFYQCSKLSAVSFPSTLREIGDTAFGGCGALETIDLSQTQVKKLGFILFEDCNKLRTVKLPPTLVSVGEWSFRRCKSLEMIDLSHTQLIEIATAAFNDCTNLSTVKVPATLQVIGERAFEYCDLLKTIDLSQTQVAEIGDKAFYSCVNLKTLRLPLSLQKLGKQAFNGCFSLKNIDLSKSKITEIGDKTFFMCSKLEEVRMPATLAAIGDYAFYSCSNMGEIDLIQTKVVEIGENAFASCKAKTVYLPSTLEVIGEDAFDMYTGGSIQVVTELSSEILFANPVWGGRPVMIASDVYTVCFHGNGAKETEEVRKIYGLYFSCILPENQFTRDNYVFTGWNTQADGSGTPYEDKQTFMNLTSEADGIVHLYAQWKKQEYTAETEYAEYLGNKYTIDGSGTVRSYTSDGEPIINEFGCDGTYTYFFQADGTAMRDRLTYHPDGVHVIYFDHEGHEVFSNFANVKKTIAGEAVDDYCFFDVYGYLYVDVVTYDQTGTYLYYANPYGVMDRGKWFEFSDSCKWADGTPFDKAGGRYGYANDNGTLLTNTWINDWEGRWCYLQGNGVAKY